MKTASDLVELWEAQRRSASDRSRLEWEQWVDEHPDFFHVAVATGAQTLLDFSMTIGSGVVDTLNLGKGAAEGGWGYLQDGLRFVSLVAPMARGGRALLSRVTADSGELGNCTWVAATKAMRLTGSRHFAAVADLADAAGLPGVAETGGAWADELMPPLRALGARVQNLGPPQGLEQVIAAAKARPNGVVMFSIEWGASSHTLLAQYSPLRGVVFADRTGAVVSSLSELETVYSHVPGISNATVAGPMVFVENARIVSSLNKAGLLGVLGLEVMAIPSPEAAQNLNALRSAPVRAGQMRNLINVHVVMPGDSLSRLAMLYCGDELFWPAIYDANQAVVGGDYNLIRPGQKLDIPDPASYSRAEIDAIHARARQWHPSR